MNISFVLGLALVLAYLYPATMLPLSGWPQVALYMAALPVVTAAALLGSRQGPEIRLSVLAFLVLTSASIIGSATVSHSAARWVGLAVLLAAAGPLLYSPFLARFRLTTWRIALALIAALTVLSFVWWLLGTASPGRGPFAGLWVHSMVLGPTAALTAIWAYVRTIEKRSGFFGLLLTISVLVCVLSASRAALFAMGVGILLASLILLRRRYYFLYAMFFGVMLLSFVSFVTYETFARPLPEHVQARVLERGFSTESREDLWRMRVDEFRASPVFGVGFAVEMRDHFRGGSTIEPGSSYLALLAQTGLLGAFGFMIFGIASLRSFFQCFRRLEPFQCSLLAGAGAMFLSHQFFEGYLLAVGSFLAFLFWLWAGVSLDRLREANRDAAPLNVAPLPCKPGVARMP